MNHFVSYDPVLLLSAILKRNATQLETPHGFIALVNPDRDSVTVEYGLGLGENYVGHILKASEGVTGCVLMSNKPCLVTNYLEWSGQFRGILPKNQPQIGAVAGTPVFAGGQLIAILSFVFEQATFCNETEMMTWLESLSESASAMLAQMETTPEEQNSGVFIDPTPSEPPLLRWMTT